MSYINRFLMAENLKIFGKCRLTMSKSLPYFLNVSPGLPKHGPYNSAINTR